MPNNLTDYNFPGQTVRDTKACPDYWEENLRGIDSEVLESCLCLNNLAYRVKEVDK